MEPILRSVATSVFAGKRLQVRIGVNTRLLIAGNLGGGGRQIYTVHGDAMNMAVLLEDINKETETTLSIADSTAEPHDRTDLQDIGRVRLLCLTGQVPVYTRAKTQNVFATDIVYLSF